MAKQTILNPIAGSLTTPELDALLYARDEATANAEYDGHDKLAETIANAFSKLVKDSKA